jgi:hypothetical protein
VGLQYQTITQRPPRKYPIELQLRYKAGHGTLHGFGQTRMMSSKDIIFAPGGGLNPGTKAEIAIAWPLLLDGHIRLQLVLETAITGNQDGVAEARILAYHFRTRGPAEPEQRTEPATLELPAGAVWSDLMGSGESREPGPRSSLIEGTRPLK